MSPSPDPYAEFGGSVAAPATQPASGAQADPYAEFGGSIAAKSQPGFGSNVLTSAGRLASSVGSSVMHPINTLSNLSDVAAGATHQIFKKTGLGGAVDETPEAQADIAKAGAVEDYYKERYGGLSNIGHTLYTDPVGAAADAAAIFDLGSTGIGAASKAADVAKVAAPARYAATIAGDLNTIAKGAKIAGKWVNPVALPFHAAGAVGRQIANRILPVSSGLTPVEGAAVDYALAQGAPVDLANATGNNFIGSAKGILQKQPLSAGIAGKFGAEQQAWLANKSGQLAKDVAPAGPKTKLTAGLDTQQKISGKLQDYRNAASTSFERLFQDAEMNPQNVQVGETIDPVTRQVIPKMADVAGPVDTSAVRTTAQTLLDEILPTIPVAQQQMSPSVSLLHQLVARPWQVDLRTAVADNSAIQNLARTEIPQLRSQAQRVASRLIGPYREAIDTAADDLGTSSRQALEDGRTATKAKYDLGNLVPRQYLTNKPTDLVRILTSGDDASVPILQKLQRHVPDALPGVARATIESIFKNSTKSGGFANVDSTFNRWSALGDQTKQMLFGPAVTDEITQLLQFAKVTGKNLNPSGTASVGSVAGLAAMMLRDPMSAIAAMAGSRQLARGVFNTDIAKTVRATGRLPTPRVPGIAAATAPLRPGPLNVATRIAPPDVMNPYRDAQSSEPAQNPAPRTQ